MRLRAASVTSTRSSDREGRARDDRPGDAHAAPRARVRRRREPRRRRPRRPAQPDLRAARGPRGRARRPALDGRGRRRGHRRAALRRRPHPRERRPLPRRVAAPRAGRAAGRGVEPAARARDGGRHRRDRRARRRPLGRAHEGGRPGAAGVDVVAEKNDKVLLRRYHEQGDLAAREQLIEQYMSLVRSLARRYSYRGEQLEDLVQIGAIGLIKAIDRFDLNRGVELTTYATPNIIGEIKRHFRDKGWSVRVPRGLQELNVQLSRLVESLTVQLGRSPTIPELAKAAGAEEEDVLEALESGRAYSSVSLSSGGSQEDGEELDPLEWIGTEEHQYEVSEDRAVLAPGFRVLDDRERMILHLRFFKGLTQSQIAQQVGISQMHVSRLIRRSLEKIRDEIAAEEENKPKVARG